MSKENKPKLINMVVKPSKTDQAKLGKEENFGQIVPKAPPVQSKPSKMQRIDEGQPVPARPPTPSKAKNKK